jgi:ribosomal protein S18 acetylase RimI-like enzyme
VGEIAARFRDASDASFTVGVFDGAALVAVATFSRETALKERHKAHVYAVYVSARYRRQGLGGRLIATLITHAKLDASLEQMLLSVDADNAAAVCTYEKLGFETYGTEPRALKVGDEYVDERLMILRLR